MKQQLERTAWLLGEEGLDRLARSRVAVFGIGGVGGYVCEALARCGVGALDLVDNDRVSVSNLNRQIIATHRTIGRYKTEVMRERIRDINPDILVTVWNCFFLPENADSFPFAEYDYVVDAVDTVTAKIEIVMRARAAGVPVISSMGTGNKLDPSAFRTADIYETSVCPLARVMRRELKKRGVESLKVVYSREQPRVPLKEPLKTGTGGEADPDGEMQKDTPARRDVPGSIAFVPPAAGLVLAGEVIRDLIS